MTNLHNRFHVFEKYYFIESSGKNHFSIITPGDTPASVNVITSRDMKETSR